MQLPRCLFNVVFRPFRVVLTLGEKWNLMDVCGP